MTGWSPAPSPPRPASVLEAVLERITYVNEDTGYTIARVATDRTGPDLLTVAGPLLPPGVIRRDDVHQGVVTGKGISVPVRFKRSVAASP